MGWAVGVSGEFSLSQNDHFAIINFPLLCGNSYKIFPSLDDSGFTSTQCEEEQFLSPSVFFDSFKI
ncbi:hypothetical protein DLM78_07830 [Leptospira stimsonii]|uniref:Uncharacterized protein n=1 Tax=Leptospira stimsonii TaxID=2202203 RepID=A0A8B3CW14_9LEPT|nr:hypothetical protein DLM78_07830 [Leptospira stimsonii]